MNLSYVKPRCKNSPTAGRSSHRIAAGAPRFLTLIQSGDRPDRQGRSRTFGHDARGTINLRCFGCRALIALRSGSAAKTGQRYAFVPIAPCPADLSPDALYAEQEFSGSIDPALSNLSWIS